MLTALRTVRTWHGPLAWFSVLMIGLAIISAVGYVVDGRILVGARIWAKPLKFAISFALYAVTLAWLLAQVQSPRWRRAGRWAGTALGVVSALEVGAIVLQVVRGRQSHFNLGTPFDAAVFTAMGALIGALYLCTLVIGVVLLRPPLRDAAFTWSLRLGIAIALAGLAVGFLMLRPTPEQIAQGPQATLSGAHSVGAPDGGAGLPFVGWSTAGGDLRIAHFIGMHALQVVPLLAFALSGAAARRRRGARTRLQIVLLGGALYGGVVALALWQALRGQALLAPDGLTLAAAGGLLATAGLGAAAIIRASHRPPTATV